jgi:hypothetical protein
MSKEWKAEDGPDKCLNGYHKKEEEGKTDSWMESLMHYWENVRKEKDDVWESEDVNCVNIIVIIVIIGGAVLSP